MNIHVRDEHTATRRNAQCGWRQQCTVQCSAAHLSTKKTSASMCERHFRQM